MQLTTSLVGTGMLHGIGKDVTTDTNGEAKAKMERGKWKEENENG